MTAIETNKKYKIEKQALLLEKKKNKRIESEKLKYDKLKKIQVDKLSKRYDTKLEKRLKKIAKQYDRKRIDTKHKILGKPIKKKTPSIEKKRIRAKREFCKYCKLSRAELINGIVMVYILDKKQRVPLDKNVNAGHYRPAHNYPQLAFIVENCRPISKFCNKQQGDNIGTRREDEFLNKLSSLKYRVLKDLSENKEEKNRIRDGNYYDKEYYAYKELNELEEKRLGISK